MSKVIYFIASVICLALLITSCKIYKKKKGNEPPKPDYTNAYYWASLPSKKDSADLVVPNSGLNDEQSTAKADVFFIHPTDNQKGMDLNADQNDTVIRNLTDHLSAKFQASAFNGSCRIYMPRSRDVKVLAYFFPKKKKEEVFSIAYGDVKDAFLYYLKYYNKGRPFILASHSQGSHHAIRLCQEFFDKDSVLNKKLVAAYLIGGGVFTDTYKYFKPCSDSLQTNCYVTFNATRYGMLTLMGKPVDDLVCVNPLTWTQSTDEASSVLNKGGLPYSYKKIDPAVADAQIGPNGLLWVHNQSAQKKIIPG